MKTILTLFALVVPVFCFAGKDAEKLRAQVRCPFAKVSKLWENRFEWDVSKSIEKNVEEFVEIDLKPFVETIESLEENGDRPIDGIALEAPGNIYAKNLDTFSEFFRRVLVTINEESVSQLYGLEPDENGIFWDDGWQFTYESHRLFIITTAPFYGIHNSRFNYGIKSAVILFQPEGSFKHHLSREPNKRNRQRENARRNFEKHGQTYSTSKSMLTDSEGKAHEAPRYIKPLNLEDEPVRWWIKKPGSSISRKKQQREDDDLKSMCSVQ